MRPKRAGPALRRTVTIASALAALVAGPAAAMSLGGSRGPTGSLRDTTATAAGRITPTPRTRTISLAPVTVTVTTPAPSPVTVTTPAATTPTTATTTTPKAPPKRPKKKPAPIIPPLTGWLGAGAVFPQRTLVLSDRSGRPLTPGLLNLTENGVPVNQTTVTPLSRARPGDFGVIVVIDQSVQMAGAPLAAAISAAQTLANLRTGAQALGVITFATDPTVILPLSTNSRKIQQAFAATPGVAPGSRGVPALTLALAQLTSGKIAAGAVILISDNGSSSASGALTARTVAHAAQAIHARLITVGVSDAYYRRATLARLAGAVGAQFIESSSGHLNKVVTNIWSQLTRGDLIRYRSSVARGHSVSVNATVDAVPGAVNATYATPAVPVVPRPRAKPVRATLPPIRALAVPRERLSGRPAFSLAPPPKTFWTSSLAVLVIAGACALLLGIAIMFLLVQSSKGGLRTRVGSYIPLAAESGEESSDGPEKRRGRLSRRVEKRRWWPQFIEDVEVARLRPAPAVLIRRAMVGSLFAAALVVFFTGSIPFGLVALFPGRFVLRAAVRRAARRQRVRFADQLPSHLQDASGAIRAGRSFVGALAAVAEKADQPMKKELDRAVADEQLGLPLEDTLQAIARRMRSDDMEQVVLIAALNRRSGSNVAEALDRVAEGARERADMTREMKALTAQAQISSRVLTGLPVVFLGAMALVSPSYAHPMLHTIGGQIALGVCAVLVVLGYKVMARITGAEA